MIVWKNDCFLITKEWLYSVVRNGSCGKNVCNERWLCQMIKAQRLIIENRLGEKAAKLEQQGGNVRYFEEGKDTFVTLKVENVCSIPRTYIITSESRERVFGRWRKLCEESYVMLDVDFGSEATLGPRTPRGRVMRIKMFKRLYAVDVCGSQRYGARPWGERSGEAEVSDLYHDYFEVVWQVNLGNLAPLCQWGGWR